MLHNTAPPPSNSFIIQHNSSNQITSSTTRGDLLIPFRKSTFCQKSFSVRAIHWIHCLPISKIYIYTPVLQHTLKHGCPTNITERINICQRWCVCLMWRCVIVAIVAPSVTCMHVLFFICFQCDLCGLFSLVFCVLFLLLELPWCLCHHLCIMFVCSCSNCILGNCLSFSPFA